MTEVVEGSMSLAWRLLATLEGGSLLLATSALLAYAASRQIKQKTRRRQPLKTVLIANANTKLGKEVRKMLESRGCTVHTVCEDITRIEATNQISRDANVRVDALVIIGAELKDDNLNGITELLARDVYENLKQLEALSIHVGSGGRIIWACLREDAGSNQFRSAVSAYDAVLQASLQTIAHKRNCEAVWVGRGENPTQVANKLADEINIIHGASFRTVVQKVGEYFGRWLKIIN